MDMGVDIGYVDRLLVVKHITSPNIKPRNNKSRNDKPTLSNPHYQTQTHIIKPTQTQNRGGGYQKLSLHHGVLAFLHMALPSSERGG